MTEQLLERKQAIKNRIDALSRELQPHLRAVEHLRERIDVLETDHRIVLDAIRDAETKQRNEEAREKAKRAPKKEWVSA
jgi:phage shock protein A